MDFGDVPPAAAAAAAADPSIVIVSADPMGGEALNEASFAVA
jgi:hypothetical protein